MGQMGTVAVDETNAIFEDAGYDYFTFTPAEQRAISAKIKKLRDEGRPQKQAIAIAISMIAPGKAKGSAAGTFAAVNDGGKAVAPEKIKIRGGSYRWHDDQDDYFTIYDVPLMSTVAKGVKGAPYDVDEPELQHYVKIAQERYHNWNFCATAFVDHNKDVEFKKPEFAGYVLPNRVGPCMMEDDAGNMVERPAVYGDLKVNRTTFERIKKGELPYHSPEVPWAKRRISGLAFLDTKPPFFEFANLTLGDEVKDISYANFSGVPVKDIKREAVGKFDGGDDDKKEKPGDFEARLKKMEAEFTAFSAQFASFMKKFDGERGSTTDTHIESTGRTSPDGGAAPASGTSEPVLKGEGEGEGEGKKGKKSGKFEGQEPPKVTPLPVEPDKHTMTMQLDPKFVATFEATQSRLAALERERSEEKAAAAKKDKLAWARQELQGKILSPTIDQTLGMFAADDEKFKAIVAEMKKSLPNEPPSTMSDFKGQAVDPSAPSVAAFAAKGPEYAEKAAQFAAEHRLMKSKKWPMSRTEEEYVKFRMDEVAGLSA